MEIAMRDQSHQTMPFWMNFPKQYALISLSLSALPAIKRQLTVMHGHTKEFFICGDTRGPDRAAYRLKTRRKMKSRTVMHCKHDTSGNSISTSCQSFSHLDFRSFGGWENSRK